ncbi:MAG TPA: hypothetical protein VI357_26635 [Mycobacteriales bacterium]
MTTQLERLRRPTEFLDYESPAVRDFVARVVPDPSAGTDIDRARARYYAVRDDIQYEVYDADLSREGLRASSIIQRARASASTRASSTPRSPGRWGSRAGWSTATSATTWPRRG